MDNKFVISKNDIEMLLAEEFHDPEIILISEHPNAKLRQCLISNIDRSVADSFSDAYGDNHFIDRAYEISNKALTFPEQKDGAFLSYQGVWYSLLRHAHAGN